MNQELAAFRSHFPTKPGWAWKVESPAPKRYCLVLTNDNNTGKQVTDLMSKKEMASFLSNVVSVKLSQKEE